MLLCRSPVSVETVENKTEHCGQMSNILYVKKDPSSRLSQDTDSLD
jgi:hypothetical protein